MSTPPPFADLLPFLQGVPIFGGVPDTHLETLWRHADWLAFEADDVIVREGEPARALYIVVEGAIVVRKGTTTLSALGPGDCVGEMALIDIQPRSADLVAMTDVKVMALGIADLLRLQTTSLETYAIVVLNLARELSRRLRLANRALVAAGLPTVE